MRSHFTWRLRTRSLDLGPRTLVMGVVNVTPDSFSDGGLYFDRDRAVQHALRLLDEGADLLDIGGESTRPGAHVAETAGGAGVAESESHHAAPAAKQTRRAVTVEEETRRVLPVIEAVLRARPDAVVSVDTYKPDVARSAVLAGAEVVNAVSAGVWDARMLPTVAELQCGAVLMHTRGRPEEWRGLPPSADIADLVRIELQDSAQAAIAAGLDRQHIVLDPGFGFGKNFEQNYPLLRGLDRLAELGFPLLTGTSRKGFVGRTLARGGKDLPAGERLYGSLAAMTATILKGAHIVRVHEVAASLQAVRVADAIVNES
jgi:dihydropteroate synthase